MLYPYPFVLFSIQELHLLFSTICFTLLTSAAAFIAHIFCFSLAFSALLFFSELLPLVIVQFIFFFFTLAG